MLAGSWAPAAVGHLLVKRDSLILTLPMILIFVESMEALIGALERLSEESECLDLNGNPHPALELLLTMNSMSLFQLDNGNVIYQNTMSAAITVWTGPEGSITRDSVYKLFFQCTYLGSQDVQVEAEVYTVAPPLPVVEQGPFDLELVIATGSGRAADMFPQIASSRKNVLLHSGL
ncbi:ZP1 protein, partial [Polypterus senegalus]